MRNRKVVRGAATASIISALAPARNTACASRRQDGHLGNTEFSLLRQPECKRSALGLPSDDGDFGDGFFKGSADPGMTGDKGFVSAGNRGNVSANFKDRISSPGRYC
ncbi:hypothetical protein [Streptomyces sp. INR7]|uniref:hypothetical protein n=1 Tax=Streptomyces sp. INR7 TaxID=2607753 RepID=UPI0016243163|nr:hypothetical protein [Streptomyces sp. INR7]QNE25911.1 hypothetical protein F1D59_14865 [Streptomyces sp. INR7]